MNPRPAWFSGALALAGVLTTVHLSAAPSLTSPGPPDSLAGDSPLASGPDSSGGLDPSSMVAQQPAESGGWRSWMVTTGHFLEGSGEAIAGRVRAIGGLAWDLAKMEGEGEAIAEQAAAIPWTGPTEPIPISESTKNLVRGVVAAARYGGQLGAVSGEGMAISDMSMAGALTGNPALGPSRELVDDYLKGVHTTLSLPVSDLVGPCWRGSAEECGKLFTGTALAVVPILSAASRFASVGETASALTRAGEIARAGETVEVAPATARVGAAAERRLVESSAKEGAVCTGPGCPEARCFAAGTLVDTEGGLRGIETLEPGDRVLARDEVTGSLAFKRVLQTIVTPDRPLDELVVEAGSGRETLRVTPNHPFYVEGHGWTPASELAPDRDELAADSKNTLRIASARSLAAWATVYNLEVEDFHTYFVGRAHAWVHNTCGGAAEDPPSPGEGRVAPPELLAEVGEVSGTITQRANEVPYRYPPVLQTLLGQPLDVGALDPQKAYVWVVDEQGRFLVAPDQQSAQGFAPNRGGVVKHGDLVPGPEGKTRGEARTGGELRAERLNGQLTGSWVLDNNSSYTFARTANGGARAPRSNLDATLRLLAFYGTDTSRIVVRDVLGR